MSINITSPHATPFTTLAATAVATILLAGCGGSTTAPTTPGVSAVVTAPNVVVGRSVEGTVSLTIAASTGMVISLSSSNPAVATVQTGVTIAEGSSSVTFTISAVAAGTARITASLDGTSRQSGTLTVTAAPLALASISLSASSVVGGTVLTGTVTLTGAAPAAGAVVSLSSGDPITVPSSVIVPSGAASAGFTISTRAVDDTIAGVITAAYGGVSGSASLAIRGSAVAGFGISGSSGSDTCILTNGGNSLSCTFNGSTSEAEGTIVAWDWSWGVAGGGVATTTTGGPELVDPSFNCSLLPAALPPGHSSFDFIVRLRIRDSLGNLSPEAANSSARLLVEGQCGF